MRPVESEIVATALVLAKSKLRAAASDGSNARPEEKIAAWAMLDALDRLDRAEAVLDVIQGLERAIFYALADTFTPDDGAEPLDAEEALKRIATSMIHARNALRKNHPPLPGLDLWDGSDAEEIAQAVGAERRGGGLFENALEEAD